MRQVGGKEMSGMNYKCTKCGKNIDNAKRLLQGKMFTGSAVGLSSYSLYLCEKCAEQFSREYVKYDTYGVTIIWNDKSD